MSDAIDVARKILINDEGELRSGWRVAVFFIAFALFSVLLGSTVAVLGILFPAFKALLAAQDNPAAAGSAGLVLFALSQMISLIAVIAATLLCALALEHRSFASVGFKLHKGWLKDFAMGSILGTASLGLAVAIAFAAGATRFQVQTTGVAVLFRDFIFLLFLFLIAGAFEELFFRGFAFQALTHNLGPGAAIAITAALFGMAHLGNPDATFYSTINVALAGIWLGTAYLMTRSLWLAFGLHYSWNLVMVFVFGLPVSGFKVFSQQGWLEGGAGPPEWLSGGGFGPEGGVAATVALILSTLIVWKSGLFSASEEMLAAIKHGKKRTRFLSLSLEDQKKDSSSE